MIEPLTLTGDNRLEVLQYLCFAVHDLNLPKMLEESHNPQTAYAMEYLDRVGRIIGGQEKWERLLLPYCAEMTNDVPHGDTPPCEERTKRAVDARTKAVLYRTEPDAEKMERMAERAKAVSEAD